MNIRCSFCQMPYTLSRIQMIDALQEIDAHKLTHYDAHCPRCKRATPIPRQRMEMFMPGWRDELKKFEVEMKENPQHAAPAPHSQPEPAAVAETESKPAPKAEASPSEGRKRAGKKTVSAKPAPKKAPATSSQKGKKTSTKKSK